MSKRVTRTNKESINNSSKRIKIEQILLKEEQWPEVSSSEDEIETPDSDTSIDSDAMNRSLNYKRKMSFGKASQKYYRLFKRDMELFQRTVDVKLQYIENLLQEVLRNQGSKDIPVQQPVPIKLPIRSVANDPKTSKKKKAKRPNQVNPLIEHVKRVYSAENLPSFPLCDSQSLEQFNADISRDDELRSALIEQLHPYAVFGNMNTHGSRISHLLGHMFLRTLLAQYTITGRRKKSHHERNTQIFAKKPFSEFIGIIGLVKAVVNHKLHVLELLTDEEVIHSVGSALKRAWDRRNIPATKLVTQLPDYSKDFIIEELDPDMEEEN